MATESMFVEPEVVIKEEPLPSACEEESFSDTSSEAPSDCSDSSATRTTSRVDRAESMAHQSNDENRSADKEEVKIRLASKHREIQRAKFILSNFPRWLQESEDLIPEVGDWTDDIKAIFDHSDLPRVVLGFMGQSGCGKSSVINALLDEEVLLPCNCMEACTAVAVEISWNTSTDTSEAYICVVQFITPEEWKEELETLIADIFSLDPGARSNPLANDESVAAAKIKAVYPDLDLASLIPESATLLLNDHAVSQILGKQIVIKAALGRSKQFAAEIKPYIDSSATNSKAKTIKRVPYWPLVKMVNIYTKSAVLSTGLVFVDLPGSGDSNAARAVIADRYMQSVAAICIVADIRRALTNSVARNLYGRGDMLKRRLLRNGLLDEERTFFVLTCTDIINNRQVIETQGLQDNTEIIEVLRSQETKMSRKEEVAERLKLLAERKKKRMPIIKELAKNMIVLQSTQNGSVCEGRKRKRADLDGEEDAKADVSVQSDTNHDLVRIQTELEKKKKAQQVCDKEIEDLLAERRTLHDELVQLEHQLTAICIKQRNSHVIHRMGIDFSLGLSELQRDLNDEGDDAAASVPKPKSTLCRNGASTFCVCAKAFQKLRGRFAEDQMPSGFHNLDDTSLPQLSKHCKEFTLNARERLADHFLADLSRLRIRMRQWADNTTPDRQVTMKQKHALEEKFKEHKKFLLQDVSTFINFIDAKISDNIAGLKRRSLGVAVKMAMQKTPEIFETWANQVPSGPTWKAICRKDGVHKSKSRGEGPILHNWNDDLADGLIKVLDRNLNCLFNEVLPSIQRSHMGLMETALKNFPTALAASCLLSNKHIANPLQNFIHTLSRHEAELQRTISNRFALAINMGRIVDQKVPLRIRRAMKPGYVVAANTKGKGSVYASKEAVKVHLEKVTSSMYNGAAKDVAEAVDNVFLMLKGNLQKDLDSKLTKIENDFEKMLVTATTTPRPETGPWKINLQAEVLEKLTAFDGVLGEFQSANDDAGGEEDSYYKDNIAGEGSEGRSDDDINEQNEVIDADSSDIPNVKVEYATFSDEED